MSFSNFDVRSRWPELYSRGLISMRECDPVPSKPDKAKTKPGLKPIGRPRQQDPDVKAADRGDDHEQIARLTGSSVHE